MAKKRTRHFLSECAVLNIRTLEHRFPWMPHRVTLSGIAATVEIDAHNYWDRRPQSVNVSWPTPTLLVVVERLCGATGARSFFQCPCCAKATVSVYVQPGGDAWACARCHRLVYRTQHQGTFDRLLNRKTAILKRIANTRIHRRTRAQLEKALEKVNTALIIFIARRCGLMVE